MTSVETQGMSPIAEGRVLLENQITFQELKNHEEEIKEEESWIRTVSYTHLTLPTKRIV